MDNLFTEDLATGIYGGVFSQAESVARDVDQFKVESCEDFVAGLQLAECLSARQYRMFPDAAVHASMSTEAIACYHTTDVAAKRDHLKSMLGMIVDTTETHRAFAFAALDDERRRADALTTCLRLGKLLHSWVARSARVTLGRSLAQTCAESEEGIPGQSKGHGAPAESQQQFTI